MTTDMNKIADKIQKLLALSGNNPSEKEAQAALLKAQKLMAQYNLEMGDINGEEKIEHTLEICKTKSNPRSKRLCTIIANSFACRAVIYGDKIAFFGRKDNSQAAASSMDYIHKVLEQGIRKVCRERGLSSSQKGAASIYNAYSLGFIAGLKEVMDAQTVALAIVVPEDVNTAFSNRFPKLRNSRNSPWGYTPDSEAYYKGKADGANAIRKKSLHA